MGPHNTLARASPRTSGDVFGRGGARNPWQAHPLGAEIAVHGVVEKVRIYRSGEGKEEFELRGLGDMLGRAICYKKEPSGEM